MGEIKAKPQSAFKRFITSAPFIIFGIFILASITGSLISTLVFNSFFFIYVVISVIGMAVLLGLTLVVYYWLDKKRVKQGRNYTQYSILIAVVIIALTVRVLAAICINSLLPSDKQTFLDPLRFVYAVFGVLTFEGQENIFDNKNLTDPALANFWSVMYYTFTLYAGACFFLLIIIGYNYVFACRTRLFFKKFNKVSKYNLYIFTSVTYDSYLLATSIIDKDKSACIIFAGDDLPKFDKDNELHSLIRVSNFYYIPIPKRILIEEEALIAELGLVFSRNNLFKYTLRHNVHIFALNIQDDKRQSAFEALNSDIVFDDITRTLKCKGLLDFIKVNRHLGKDKPNNNHHYGYLYYHVLSNNELNYEFYEKRLVSVLDTFYNEHIDVLKGHFKELKSIFQLRIINESRLIGENLIEKRNQTSDFPLISNDLLNSSKDYKHRAVVYGFGLNGQQSLDALFEISTAIHPVVMSSNHELVPTKLSEISMENIKDFKPDDFEVLIFDKRMDNIIGDYIEMHPCYLFKKAEDIGSAKEFINYKRLEKAYLEMEGYKDNATYSVTLRNYFQDLAEKGPSNIINTMNFPRIYFENSNYDSSEANDIVRTFAPNSKMEFDLFYNIDSVIVTLGDDEENIKAANTIITRLRQDHFYDQDDKAREVTTIFVNIRDERNRDRLNWNQDIDSSKCPYIRVITYGSREDIYSYDNIIFEDRCYVVNALYNLRILPGTDIKELFNRIDTTAATSREMIDNEMRKYDYSKLSLFKMGSNYHSALFAKNTAAYIERYRGSIKEVHLHYLSELEHNRWCRFQMANGCIFGAKIYNKANQDNFLGNFKMDDNIEESGNMAAIGEYSSMIKEHYVTKRDIIDYFKTVVKVHDCLAPYYINHEEFIRPANKNNDIKMALFCEYILGKNVNVVNYKEMALETFKDMEGFLKGKEIKDIKKGD